MKNLILIFAITISMSAQNAFSTDICKEASDYTVESCHTKTMEMFSDIKNVNQSMCENNKGIPLNQGKCEKSVDGIMNSYKEMEAASKKNCQLVPQVQQKCAACQGSSSTQTSCQNFMSDILNLRKSILSDYIARMKSIRGQLKKLDHMGFEVADDYAKNLKENENLILDPATANTPTNSASEVGVSTPIAAVNAHQGMSSSEAMQAIQQFSSISGSTNADDADNIQSPLIREQVKTSLTARSFDNKLAQYEQQIEQINTADQKNIATIDKNSSNMGTMQNAGTSPSTAAQAAGAGAGAGMSPSQQQANAKSSNGSLAATNAKSLNSSNTYTTAPNSHSSTATALKEGGKALNANNADATANSSSGNSKLKDSLNSSLAAKLKSSGASMMGSAPSRSAAAAAANKAPKLDAKGKPLSAEAQKLAASVGDMDLGGGTGMNFNSSEINGSMADLLGKDGSAAEEFYGDAAKNQYEGGGSRELASEQGANVIQGEESAALFDRIRECHIRSLKTGNILYGFAARESSNKQ